MVNTKYYIEIKDKKISVIVRNYRNSNNLKIFFRGDILNISKPARMNFDEVMKIIKGKEEWIYEQYRQITSVDSKKIKHWIDGEKILYKGEEFTVVREKTDKKRLEIFLEVNKKQLRILVPMHLEEEEKVKKTVDYGIKELFKNNTGAIIQERLPYWSKVTGIEYESFKIRDAISKFGSCIPSTKALHFSARLVMLPQDKVDAIIVHELCHIIHGNHSKDFYDLVKKYIQNYDEIDKWLKQNSSLIMI